MTVRIIDAYPPTWREPDGTQARVTGGGIGSAGGFIAGKKTATPTD